MNQTHSTETCHYLRLCREFIITKWIMHASGDHRPPQNRILKNIYLVESKSLGRQYSSCGFLLSAAPHSLTHSFTYTYILTFPTLVLLKTIHH